MFYWICISSGSSCNLKEQLLNRNAWKAEDGAFMLPARKKETEVIRGVNNSGKAFRFLAAQAQCYCCALLEPGYLAEQILTCGSSASHAADTDTEMSFLKWWKWNPSAETHFPLTLYRTFLHVFKQETGVWQLPNPMVCVEACHISQPVIIPSLSHSIFSSREQVHAWEWTGCLGCASVFAFVRRSGCIKWWSWSGGLVLTRL